MESRVEDPAKDRSVKKNTADSGFFRSCKNGVSSPSQASLCMCHKCEPEVGKPSVLECTLF